MRVCITGLGLVCPSGLDVPSTLAALWAGQSAIQALPASAEYGGAAMACGVCPDEVPLVDIAPHLVRGIDRVSLYSLASAQQALAQAEVAGPLARAEMPLVWGCSMGGLGTLDEAYQDLITHAKRRVRPTTVPYAMPSAAAFHVAHHLGVRGPSTTLTVACASSALAIAQGCRLVATGEAPAVLVGGAESMMKPATRRAWQMSQAVCDAELAQPEQSCRPFSAARHGFAMGEGGAALVLESEASARARGAQVLGWVRGWGHTTDALHISKPDTQAQIQAMQRALAHAEVAAQDISYLNAHGTATPAGDASEGAAILAVFGCAGERHQGPTWPLDWRSRGVGSHPHSGQFAGRPSAGQSAQRTAGSGAGRAECVPGAIGFAARRRPLGDQQLLCFWWRQCGAGAGGRV